MNTLYFSVERPEHTEEQIKRYDSEVLAMLCDADTGSDWQSVQGCYEGVREQAYKVTASDDKLREYIYKAFNDYKQQSVLLVHEDSEATMLFNDGDFKHMGKFQRVTKESALSRDAYSIVGSEYYIVQ